MPSVSLTYFIGSIFKMLWQSEASFAKDLFTVVDECNDTDKN